MLKKYFFRRFADINEGISYYKIKLYLLSLEPTLLSKLNPTQREQQTQCELEKGKGPQGTKGWKSRR